MQTMLTSAKILIVGGASLDILTIYSTDYTSPGGAGLYTALAAVKCGADVTLLAPLPNPMPEELTQAAALVNWIGPTITPSELPVFHIIQEQGKTIYKKAFFGAEESLKTDVLPSNLSEFDLVHVAPLGDTARQCHFISACRDRNAKIISAGTGMPLIKNNLEKISAVIHSVDLFFMNEEEAHLLFPDTKHIKTSTGKVLFVTKGPKGTSVYIGDHEIDIESVDTNGLDPTGAGDTFCGATITGIACGEHPLKAALAASALAAEMISGIGPEKLLRKSKSPEIHADERVQVNQDQVRRTAKLISGLKEEKPYNFIASFLPHIDHPLTVNYFFATTLQQFSFWTTRDEFYHLPLIETIGGEKLKGAFYLFMAYQQKLENDPEYFSPERQANQTLDEMVELFRADDGKDVMPAVELHLAAAHRYGKTMLNLGWTPQSIIKTASETVHPLKSFLGMLDHVGGYREDPLRKKSALLAMILNNRPEKYFKFGENEFLPPIIDYHCMRSNLRMGLIDVVDNNLRNNLENRALVSENDEWAVRYAAYRAVDQLPILSGRSMATVDEYFFFSRKRCPEMTVPECSVCSADPVCAHRKELFQPVIRTDFY